MERHKDIKVVILSSTKSQMVMEQLQETGVADYIAKPSSFDDDLRVAAGNGTHCGG
jgi:DNA-binding NarL/FixJ family response regulator